MSAEEEVDELFRRGAYKQNSVKMVSGDKKGGVIENNLHLEKLQIDEELIRGSIVSVPDDSSVNVMKSMVEITKQLTDDSNIFKFSNQSRIGIFEIALLKTIGERPIYDKSVRPRYEFIMRFLYNYSMLVSAIKSGQAERFSGIASSLMSFQSTLEYRKAGVMEAEQRNGFIDKLRGSK